MALADMLCADVDTVVIVTAAAEHPEPGTLDAEFAAGLATEREALDRLGLRVEVMHASAADRAALGDHMFSTARAAEAVTAGRGRGRQSATGWPARRQAA